MCKPGRGILSRSQICQPLGVGLPASRTVRNQCVISAGHWGLFGWGPLNSDTSIPEPRAQPESRVLDLYSPISDNSTVRSEQGIVARWLVPLTRIWSCFSNLGTSLK